MVAIDKHSGTLAFTTGPSRETSTPQSPRFSYTKYLRLPITVSCDITKQVNGQFQIDLGALRLWGLICFVRTTPEQPQGPFQICAAWHDIAKNGKFEILFSTKVAVLDEPFEKDFRLPVPNAKISGSCGLGLEVRPGVKPTRISRLELQGRICPKFGLGLEQDQKQVVFVKRVVEKSLAEKAGFQSGDIIVAINGKRPKSSLEALDMLGRLQIGEEVVFTIARAEKTQEIRVTAEF